MSNHIIKQFIRKAIKISTNLDSLEQFKRAFSKENKISLLKNPDVKKVYDEMVAKKEIPADKNFEQLLITKKIRTLSGVAVVSVLTKPYPCPGKCLYCPNEKSMPKSYLSNEPAVMRAIANKFNPYRQVQSRIKALEINGHATDKIELIVMGGTFSCLTKSYQKKFIAECFRAANDYPISKIAPPLDARGGWEGLLSGQKRNEKSKHRIIGLTLETRPDYIDEKEIINFRNLGCTRLELGVQNIFDDVLEKNKRGHRIRETINATKLLKNAGFKINYHIMPGMYGSSAKKDMAMFKKLFSMPDFQPDMLKIYPCVVTAGSLLHKLWKNKKYHPLTNKRTEKLISKIKILIPPYVRISRLIRDIPSESIVAGPNILNLRQILQQKKTQCQCIRCREVRGNYDLKEKIILDRIDYSASGGKEIFLQFVSPDKQKLFALLRLRLPSKTKPAFNSLQKSAIIRELHTYGKLTEINKLNKHSPQHIGLGKKLVLEAERIAKEEFNVNKIAIISGIGVRGYYRKLGYRLKDGYMIKSI